MGKICKRDPAVRALRASESIRRRFAAQRSATLKPVPTGADDERGAGVDATSLREEMVPTLRLAGGACKDGKASSS